MYHFPITTKHTHTYTHIQIYSKNKSNLPKAEEAAIYTGWGSGNRCELNLTDFVRLALFPMNLLVQVSFFVLKSGKVRTLGC